MKSNSEPNNFEIGDLKRQLKKNKEYQFSAL